MTYQIVARTATLLWATPDAERQIERIGRVCYKSEDRITDQSHIGFVRRLRKNGHGAMLEHASASILFTTDRGVSHELVRHRMASFAQESTRYCNYGNRPVRVIPPNTDGSAWLSAIEQAVHVYQEAVYSGVKPEVARDVLPTCLATDIVVTANLREWLHILSLRLAPEAHPKMRALMRLAVPILKGVAPTVFEEIEAC